MADEIELKLELSPVGAERILASDLLSRPGKIAQQMSTYFDTPCRAVAKAGFSLRIRRIGETRIQTIKADGPSAAGLFMRTEWEQPVESDIPVLDHTAPLRSILGDACDRLGPVFSVRVERRTWVVDEDGTKIEVVLDRGEVVASPLSEPICELELELALGDPTALFGLARELDAIAPLHLGVVPKSERGYRLTRERPAFFKAEDIALVADANISQAFKQIVQSCIRQYRLNETSLLANRDPDALHQARVAIRRMRSAFSIFKPMIGDAGAGLQGELRWLAAMLGEVRDLDVLLDRAPPGPLREIVAAARDAASDRLLGVLVERRARLIMLNVAHFLTQGRWTDGASEADGLLSARVFATTVLTRLRRRVKQRGKTLASSDDGARHDVRKDAKKLRYASEFFASLFSRKREQRRYRRFVSALAELQNRLGALNDAAAASEVIGRLEGVEPAAAEALLTSEFGRKKMLRNAEEAHDELFDTKKFW